MQILLFPFRDHVPYELCLGDHDAEDTVFIPDDLLELEDLEPGFVTLYALPDRPRGDPFIDPLRDAFPLEYEHALVDPLYPSPEDLDRYGNPSVDLARDEYRLTFFPLTLFGLVV